MAKPSFSPKFLRAGVKFELDGHLYNAGDQLINLSGVPGFEWTEFDPMQKIGVHVRVIAELYSIDANKKYTVECNGRLVCEQTARQSQLAIHVRMSPEDREYVEKTIADEGALPEYVRKFPRIGFNERIQAMPTLSILRFKKTGRELMTACEIENLSPTGFQIATEDQRVEELKTGDAVVVEILPRGDFDKAVLCNCEIRRLVRSIDMDTENRRWAFGMAVIGMDENSKQSFSEMLRSMVVQLQKDGI